MTIELRKTSSNPKSNYINQYNLSLSTKMKLQSRLKYIRRYFLFITLFPRKVQIQTGKTEAYLENIALPKLTK